MHIYAAFEKLKEQEQDAQKRRILEAVAVVCNQMLEKYQKEIAEGKMNAQDIVKIGNNYIKAFHK